jgi:16S rRNA (uracil1498-N3)-methyltransferase
LRAIYYPFERLSEGQTVQVIGDAAHHLNVVRVKNNEELLLLNGSGAKLIGKITAIQKNLVEIKITHYEEVLSTHNLSLAIANPKKVAFEDILKASVELGIKNIYPLSSDFSQYDYVQSERIDRILESALIQSNNPYFPVIHSQQSLKEFLKSHLETIVFFNSKESTKAINDSTANETKTILIGPEGGFSPAEIQIISQYSKIQEIHLATPILRAPTAVASSVGYLLAMRNNIN